MSTLKNLPIGFICKVYYCSSKTSTDKPSFRRMTTAGMSHLFRQTNRKGNIYSIHSMSKAGKSFFRWIVGPFFAFCYIVFIGFSYIMTKCGSQKEIFVKLQRLIEHIFENVYHGKGKFCHSQYVMNLITYYRAARHPGAR